DGDGPPGSLSRDHPPDRRARDPALPGARGRRGRAGGGVVMATGMDPAIQALLDQSAAANLPPIHQLTLADMRAGGELFGANGAGAPEPMARVEDRTFPGPGGDVAVRVYTPVETAPLPGIVYFHGGGWVMMSL